MKAPHKTLAENTSGFRISEPAPRRRCTKEERGHFFQCYEKDEYLIESVAAFLNKGLATGERALVLATAPHREALQNQLGGPGADNILYCDAAEMLSRVLVEGMPDEGLFREALGGRVAKAKSGRRLRIFGELSALLLEQERSEAALRLESQWNGLGRLFGFTLFCAYPLRVLGRASEESFACLCGAHSHVIPAESYSQSEGKERLLAIARLQWQAAALRHEASAREQAEAALRAAEEKLRQARKMESIGRLAGGIAHDFKNLLTAINGYSDMTLSMAGVSATLRECLEEIRKAGDHAVALTHQILSYSRKQAAAHRLFDLRRLVEETGRMLERTIGDEIALQVEIASEPAWIEADPDQIQQVILNLALNARDAMPGGGRLTLGCGCTAAGDVPLPKAVLTVRDTGIGMSAEVRARIFEPFFTTKPPGQGTGIGLSTAWEIVREAEGSMAVDSAPGQGTEFRVCFPLAAAGVGGETAAPA